MRSAMQSDRFRNAYLDKGRMRHIAAETAVRLVTDEESGLRGAIEYGFKKAETG